MNFGNSFKRFSQKYKAEIKVGLVVMVGLIVLRILKDLLKRS
jgi:hypothetical protein